LWLRVRSYRKKLFTAIISLLSRLSGTKFRECSSAKAFSNFELNGEGRENVPFSAKNWPYIPNGER